MTREKAIKLFRKEIECLSHDKCSDCILEKVCDPMKTPPDSKYIEAYGMAIEALSAEPCEDAISRKTLMEMLTSDGFVKEFPRFSKSLALVIGNLPSVTPKQKMGHWEICEDADGIYVVCDICGKDADFSHYGDAYSYCPNCGAKMEESE